MLRVRVALIESVMSVRARISSEGEQFLFFFCLYFSYLLFIFLFKKKTPRIHRRVNTCLCDHETFLPVCAHSLARVECGASAVGGAPRSTSLTLTRPLSLTSDRRAKAKALYCDV